MSRLPLLRYDDLDPARRQVWDAITGSRGPGAVDAGGHLTGPFNAFVHAPEAGARLSALGAALRFGTSLGPRLTEIAIVTVAARWEAEFEWHEHARMARARGVPDAAVAAIGRGADPGFTDPADRAVHAAARQLARTGHLDADAYAAAQAVFGDAGMVELVALCGYYSLVAFLLNAFEVPPVA